MGIVLISRADRLNENFILLWIRSVREWLGEKTEGIKKTHQRLTRWAYSLTHRSKLIRVMDRYVIRTFIFYFLLVLIAFVSLFIIVTVFELVNQIVRNHISISTVVLYFIYLTPQMLIWVVPLTTLLAILISLGTLTKSNEVLAIKAAGVSLYRLSTPLLFMGLLLSGGLYLIQEFVLPIANQRQDSIAILLGKEYSSPISIRTGSGWPVRTIVFIITTTSTTQRTCSPTFRFLNSIRKPSNCVNGHLPLPQTGKALRGCCKTQRCTD
jgi:hypothetical protein